MTENENAKHITDAAFLIDRTGGTMKKLVATLRRGVKNILGLTRRRTAQRRKNMMIDENL